MNRRKSALQSPVGASEASNDLKVVLKHQIAAAGATCPPSVKQQRQLTAGQAAAAEDVLSQWWQDLVVRYVQTRIHFAVYIHTSESACCVAAARLASPHAPSRPWPQPVEQYCTAVPEHCDLPAHVILRITVSYSCNNVTRLPVCGSDSGFDLYVEPSQCVGIPCLQPPTPVPQAN
jgi:hypothetical protein